MDAFRIYYDDGYVFHSETHSAIPFDRRSGVQVVVFREADHNWGFLSRHDWYLLLRDGTWLGVDTFGLYDQLLLHVDQIRYALAGRMMEYVAFRQIFERAQRDCNPPKTGWRAGEKA